ncbi:SMC family ATPase [Oerskovia turbata]|uniref:Nuclease SbcCD subunit C n=1 Tax=Oerskovia turbata TaxID=1713 RepID=A0A4Q1KRT7_9CELL|nr:SMC family ATPase [Oerskovia turbata]RXR22723.1 SMC family ATPase [Oerskovia turbata]RXR32059.1 SMC family ATPase [Oerskovia turbata]
MHLHTLTLQAIGPFAGRHVIDFAELATSGIFLLEGPTGAGKSTIIDAVVFALYGKVASEAASEDRLRSAYAAPDVESFVDLVFETGSGVYRVRRTPEFQRAKKRGTGTTTQQAGVKLWRLAGADQAVAAPGADADDVPGELLSTRLDEAGLEIQRAVGLDRRQFVQTIVLPQGEFANFLRADPEHRRSLLQKVFGTEIYDRVQTELAALNREAQGSVSAAKGAATGAVENFVGAAGLTSEAAATLREAARDETRLAGPLDTAEEPVGESDGEGDGHSGGAGGAGEAGQAGADTAHVAAVAAQDESVAAAAALPSVRTLVHRHVAAMQRTADELGAREISANSALVAARDAFEAARTLSAAVVRRDALLAEQAALDAAADQVATDREVLAAARRAAVVEPVLAGARRAATEHAAARERLLLARTGVPESLATADVTALDVLRSSLAAASTRLARLLPVGESLPIRERDLVDGRKEVERDREERARVLADLAARPAGRAERESRRDELADVAGRLGERQEKVLTAESVLRAARQAVETGTALDAARVGQEQAVAAARAASDAEHALRTAWLGGIAGELAEGLEPGDACPVCGAHEHPAPARTSDEHVSRDDVETAEAARRNAEEVVAAASAEVATLAERLDGFQRAAGGVGVGQAQAALAAAKELVSASAAAATARAEATAALAAFDAETAQLTTLASTLAERIAGESARLDALAAGIAQDRHDIVTELDATGPLLADADLPDPWADQGASANPVAVLAAALRDRDLAVSTLLDAEAAVARTSAAVEARAAEVAAVLAEAGFDDEQQVVDALVPAERREELERSLRMVDADTERIRRGLAEEAIVALPADVDVDLDGARDAVGQAEDAERMAALQANGASRRATAAATAATEIESTVAAWGRAREDAAPVARMAALAAGSGADNAKALSLATFVLVRRFEDVVAAANERLREMSDGRYELERSDEKEDVRTRRTGLAMKVLDHRTEQARDPRTLSGGETFYVSLCLALGMADVVTAEVGGVDLGTLFVDEGFGTLDPETLEAVLGELGKLRAGGRVVGVVSHVDALKASIAERVEVRRLANGSSTLTVRA